MVWPSFQRVILRDLVCFDLKNKVSGSVSGREAILRATLTLLALRSPSRNGGGGTSKVGVRPPPPPTDRVQLIPWGEDRRGDTCSISGWGLRGRAPPGKAPRGARRRPRTPAGAGAGGGRWGRWATHGVEPPGTTPADMAVRCGRNREWVSLGPRLALLLGPEGFILGGLGFVAAGSWPRFSAEAVFGPPSLPPSKKKPPLLALKKKVPPNRCHQATRPHQKMFENFPTLVAFWLISFCLSFTCFVLKVVLFAKPFCFVAKKKKQVKILIF